MPNKLWQPIDSEAKLSQMAEFMVFINAKYRLTITEYADLYQFSINRRADFWASFADFAGIEFNQPYQQVLIEGNHMLEAQWFVGGTLNFAAHLLPSLHDKPALIAINENHQRQSMSYHELNFQVRQVAHSLRQHGLQAGDRVAGVLPNGIEAVVAMLATSSIGAIWSACSPDFGYQGLYDRLRQIKPKFLFATDGHVYAGKRHTAHDKIIALQKNIPSLQQTIIVPTLCEQPINGTLLWKELLMRDPPPLIFEALPFDHPLYILFSSGTTGAPKCIVHGAGGTLIQHLKELRLHTNLSDKDTIMYFTTCGWMMWHWLVSSLSVGATLVLYDGSPLYPKNSRLFDVVEQEKITVFGTNAKYISAIEKAGVVPNKSHDLTHLKTLLSTGSPLLPDNYAYVYRDIKSTVQLSSIAGGTDIISCFALGNPMLPVYKGELQCIGLGMQVEIFNTAGKSLQQQKGELVCTASFPSMPIYFWADKQNKLYHNAYFSKFPGVWAHGDYAEITNHGGLIIYGRSDTVLNPGGVRIGTAEIYRVIEQFQEILDSVVIGQPFDDDIRLVLFVVMRPKTQLTADLITTIKAAIKKNISPHHVPHLILAAPDVPRTFSGKIMELAVKKMICGETIDNIGAIANPESLAFFKTALIP